MDTRIWCEFTPPKEVCRKHIIDALKRYEVGLNYKLEYRQDNEDFYDMIKTYNDKGIPVSIWATLSDEMGYWINEKNVSHFDAYVRELVEKLESKSVKIRGLCIDLESPLEDIKNLSEPKNIISPLKTYTKMLTSNLNKKRFNEARKVFAETAHYLHSKGLESYATCIRHCYYDIRFNSEFMQNALEIPVFDVDWDKYNLMYYATMIRNEMKKIKKVDVDYLIYHQVSHLKEVLKDKLSISVGVTNVGKLGNEPYYDDIKVFEKDMGILKGIGIDSFSLFSLDGITEEKKLLEFLDVMQRAEPYKPEVCNHVIRNEVLSELLFNIGKAYYRIKR
ncbi:MAG TPA: hypothetical protein VD757_01165 [Candidatus Nitrosocosmicus sp.]|nr:hypothetical protein [Candidatus Nitrosocosmicus sp.]